MTHIVHTAIGAEKAATAMAKGAAVTAVAAAESMMEEAAAVLQLFVGLLAGCLLWLIAVAAWYSMC
jgi:hypothetical protein